MSTEVDTLKKQRTFIHDISSPITVAIGMVDTSIRRLNRGDEVEIITDKLEKALNALSRVADLLKSRRHVLIELSETKPKDSN